MNELLIFIAAILMINGAMLDGHESMHLVSTISFCLALICIALACSDYIMMVIN